MVKLSFIDEGKTKEKRKGTLPNSFYEVSNTEIPKDKKTRTALEKKIRGKYS